MLGLTGAPDGILEVLLQTSCPDCIVGYINNYVHGFPLLMLLSKRQRCCQSSGGVEGGERGGSDTKAKHCNAFIFSHAGKRQTVSEAELTEFQTQAKCLGWVKPVLYSPDHGDGKYAPNQQRVKLIGEQ